MADKDLKNILPPRPVLIRPRGAGRMVLPDGRSVYTGRNWGKMYIQDGNLGGRRSRKYYKDGGKVSKSYKACGATVITGRD
tara:strand:- start:46 stop:288 length:243 start_codon:yes stop_codon:yes gene_type:complete